MQEKKHFSNAEIADIIHQVSNFYTSTKVPHDYGTGTDYTSVEVHMVKYIADNPGITVSDIARDYGRSKGAISQILKKLEEKGLVFRENVLRSDNKNPLYVTEKGKDLNEAHRAYDELRFGESINPVRELYTQEEIDTTVEVLRTWLTVRREVQQRRILQKKALAAKEK